MSADPSLGLDIGSVNAKAVLCDADGTVLLADAEKIIASPRAAVGALLRRLDRHTPLSHISSAGVSGVGKDLIPAEFGWAEFSSSLAVAAGVLHRDAGARTIIQVGGQSSLVVRLQDGLRRPWQVATNPLCAAGTGRFLEQQAYRLGIELDDFAVLALECKGRPPRIAARCSVFAKSDLIHLQQKGTPVSAMLYALCESIARMVASLSRGAFEEPIYLVGGVAANRAFQKALDEMLSARNGRPAHAMVPENYLHAQALGAALMARGRPARVDFLPSEAIGHAYLAMPPLEREGNGEQGTGTSAETVSLFGEADTDSPPSGTSSLAARRGAVRLAYPLRMADAATEEVPCACTRAGYLGVDVGSTSTKAAIIADDGKSVLLKHYLMTAGRPIDAVKQLFRELLAAGAGEIAIQGVGVTGSGRYLVGSFIGADLIKNEITAQTRAAADIDPDADIIEIGGQDSKLVLKRNGVVIDYQMNKACAAGTGSFIDELAELLGVSVKDGQFARLAFAAPQTIDLGTRCAAFMAQAVATAQQEGQSLEVITSSLAVAIARNYLSKVVGTRKLGPKVILTGAVFYNDAVAAAFRAQLPGKTLVVAEHREVSGAIGAALLAREARLAGSAATPGGPGASAHPSGTPAGPGPCDPAGLPQGTCRGTSFKGFAATVAAEPRLSTFTCRACANNCTITRMQMPGSPTTFYGSRCDRYDARFDGDGTGRRMATGGAEDDGEKGDGHVSTPGGTAPARGAPSSRPRATFFDERERLLFRELQPLSGLSTQRAAGLQARPGPQAAPHAPGAEPGAGRAPTRGAELRGASGPGPLAAPAADPRSEGKGAGGAGSASGPTVAIPRALLVYDYAPLLAGFLDALGARAVFSERTDQQVLEQAVELSYTDSCFPLKLLHGHVARLREADFILYPSLLRLAPREGDENQHYACPLVQASPYIVRTALDLGARLIVPALDLSRGPEPVVRSLAGAARQMGYSRRAGLRAARAGLAAQERFSADLAALGRQRLAELEARSHAGGQEGGLGVVLFARSYMAQDAGANLGIAEKLARLGVVPVPLDFLPLSTVDPRRYSDRPYWHYESRQIAAAALTAAAPHLYGLVLTNFGCGPNSFVLRLIEDIMGAKPLGQMEIDEHAAEAGLVTRLEAFVDTIRAHAKQAAGRAHALHAGSTTNTTPGEGSASSEAFRHYRGATPTVSTGKTLLLPRMAPHADVLRAAFEACGVRALVLPEPDERNLLYANQVTSGVECLPYRVSLGDFIRAHHEMNGEMAHAEGFMAGSYGPCRLGKYAIEQMRILKDLGIDLTIHSTVSNSAYRDLGLGPGFERLAWRGIVAMDSLQKLLWRARPYERQPGAADAAFEAYTARLAERVLHKEAFAGLLRQATAEFRSLIDPALPRRPRVGINGEIFLRANCFANSDLVRVCERAGLEVVVSPLGEWFKYTAFRNVEDAYHDRRIGKTAVSYIRQLVQERDERAIEGLLASGEARPTSRTWGPRDRKPSAEEMAGEREPSTAELLACSSRWLSPTCGSEAVLSLGSGVAWMESPHFAGVISVMPHGCMPGGIVAAMSEKLSAQYGKPWINLTYDGFMETNNLARINNFAEVLRFSQTGA